MIAVLGCRARGETSPPRPSVVLITLDTTRADHLGCYGYRRRTSPNLDRLAAESRLHTRAVATSSWTLPAHASLFTGKLETSHGAGYHPDGPLSLASAVPGPPAWKRYRARGLPESETTLAEILKRAGYATGAVVAGPWLKRPFGLAQGFDFYDDDHIDSSDGRRAESVTAAALRWLERTPSRPVFLFLNYYDPHGPYGPPDPFLRRFLPAGVDPPGDGIPTGETLAALYDAEILYMDHHLGALLDGVRSIGLYQNALIVVTADHGELLGEHGEIGHGQTLTEPELRIPLIVKPPGRNAPSRNDAPVQLTDILPIVLHETNLDVPASIQGGLPPRRGHPVVAEVYPLGFDSPRGHWRALFDRDWKLLWNDRSPPRLFDLASDPGEDRDLARREVDRTVRMSRLLDAYLVSLPRPGDAGPPRALDRETQEALRSLGYVR
jgi:arylsulfatase